MSTNYKSFCSQPSDTCSFKTTQNNINKYNLFSDKISLKLMIHLSTHPIHLSAYIVLCALVPWIMGTLQVFASPIVWICQGTWVVCVRVSRVTVSRGLCTPCINVPRTNGRERVTDRCVESASLVASHFRSRTCMLGAATSMQRCYISWERFHKQMWMSSPKYIRIWQVCFVLFSKENHIANTDRKVKVNLMEEQDKLCLKWREI